MTDVQYVSVPVEDDSLLVWHDISHEGHFWFEWRYRVLMNLLVDLGAPISARMIGLDVGCGRSLLGCQIEKNTSWIVDGTDLDEKALSRKLATKGHTFLYDLNERCNSFRNKYDFIILFDILEHLSQVEDFVGSTLFHLKPGGWIFVNVPAIPSLFSYYDKCVGHVRRYNKSDLNRILPSDLVQICGFRYWGLSMVPLLIMRKYFVSGRFSKEQVRAVGFRPPSKLIGKLLWGLMRLETSCVKTPLIGTSLMMVARKNFGDKV